MQDGRTDMRREMSFCTTCRNPLPETCLSLRASEEMGSVAVKPLDCSVHTPAKEKKSQRVRYAL